ncbi:MAG: hypothetical protein EON92_10055 [Burkholderiales bacterium]|nr:MAG: hypothetical protein EON92_10055 [Burkholderiales bacterium]
MVCGVFSLPPFSWRSRSHRKNRKNLLGVPFMQYLAHGWRWIAAGTITFSLAACGGSGGGANAPAGADVVGGTPADGGSGVGTGAAADTPILDSFGQTVVLGGAGGFASGDAGVDGTAAEGAAIAGASVAIVDSTGKSVSATTDAQGYYRANVTGLNPPMVATVTKADGKPLYSLSSRPLKSNGFITLNITSLTDKIASDVAKAAGRHGAAELLPQIVAAHPKALTAAVGNLRTQLASVIGIAGLDADSFDPLGAPFRPNHTGYDFVLDNTRASVAADGATLLAIAPTFVLPGRWSLDIGPGSTPFNDGIFGAGALVDLPGDAVPTEAASASDWCAASFARTLSSGAINGTGTCEQNIFTLAPRPNTSLTALYTLTSFHDCGSCSVGSKVTVAYRVDTVYKTPGLGGLLTLRDTFTSTTTYVRKS